MHWMCGFIKENENVTSNMSSSTLNGSVSGTEIGNSSLTAEENIMSVQQDFITFCNMIITPSLSGFGIFGNCINLIILTKKVG